MNVNAKHKAYKILLPSLKICAMKLTRSSKIFGEDLTSPKHIISPL
jgi:hypothetical protein